MTAKQWVLGLDTSNYTTSVAAVAQNRELIGEYRRLLFVPKGQRGLRQQEALFQHIGNLPKLLESLCEIADPEHLAGIAVSNRPRPRDDSYMPVFQAGWSVAGSLAHLKRVPLWTFSHQAGHIAAAAWEEALFIEEPFLVLQLSGGTAEALLYDPLSQEIDRLGGSKDISFGQLIDRIGVRLGFAFPAGAALDDLAVQAALDVLEAQTTMDDSPALAGKDSGGRISPRARRLKPAYFDGMDFNLSGLETQALRLIDEMDLNDGMDQNENRRSRFEKSVLAVELFEMVGDAIINWIDRLTAASGRFNVLLCGGVAASRTLSSRLHRHYSQTDPLITGRRPGRTAASDSADPAPDRAAPPQTMPPQTVLPRTAPLQTVVRFGRPELCSDNAAGIALLGARQLWPGRPK